MEEKVTLKELSDLLCSKLCGLSEILGGEIFLEDWQIIGCTTALNDLNIKLERILEVIARQKKLTKVGQ